MPETLRLVGLSTKLHSYPDQLSGGEQQRVSIARAFVNHPPLLLADEPSGNLDPVTSIGVMQLLYRINKTGTTVVVVTHDREMVDNMRRRVIELYEGRVVRDEVSGGYTEESTTEFGVRMRAEMGVAPEGQTNGHDSHDSSSRCRDSSSSPRRHSARCAATAPPSMAAIVTTVTTVILLGVLIPVFQTDAGQERRGSRRASNSRSAVYDDATKGEIAALEEQAGSDPARRLGAASSARPRPSKELKEDLGKRRPKNCLAQLHGKPAAGELPDQARRRRQPRRVRAAVIAAGPDGKPKPISPIVDKTSSNARKRRRRSSR